MYREKISSTQFVTLIIFFEFGSTIIVGLSFEARQDAWISILIGMVGGLILYSIYTSLYKTFPNQTLTSYVSTLLGNVMGRFVAIAYIMYFFYLSARVLRDFCSLLVITVLEETPLIIVMILFSILIIFAASLGVETISRTSEIFFPIVMISGWSLILFVYLNGIPQVENLQPPIENGWWFVIDKAIPKTITFPFGELIAFTMLFPFLKKEEKIGRLGVKAIIVSAISLVIVNLTILASLGVDLALYSTFPLLDTIAMINLFGIIQRLDPILIMIVVIVGFFKITIFFLAAFIGVTDVMPSLKKRNKVRLLLTLGGLLILVSLFMSDSYVEHIFVGLKIIPTYVHLPMQIIIPSILLFLSIIRKA